MGLTVYRIQKIPAGDNAYGVDRSERWTTVTDQYFDSHQEAHDYVCAENFKWLPQAVAEAVLAGRMDRREACLDARYMKHHRYFIYKPDLMLLQAALEADGIRVIHD